MNSFAVFVCQANGCGSVYGTIAIDRSRDCQKSDTFMSIRGEASHRSHDGSCVRKSHNGMPEARPPFVQYSWPHCGARASRSWCVAYRRRTVRDPIHTMARQREHLPLYQATHMVEGFGPLHHSALRHPTQLDADHCRLGACATHRQVGGEIGRPRIRDARI